MTPLHVRARHLLMLELLASSALQADWEYRAHIGLDSQLYVAHPNDKHANNFTLEQQLELAYSKDDYKLAARLYAQQDSYDATDEKNGRTFARLDELYVQYELENGLLFGGKNIRFWGALEAYNPVDAFDTVEFRSDLLDEQREGSWNVAYSYYTQTGEIALIIKLHENAWQMAKYPYVYDFLPEFVHFDNKLEREEGFYPTIYLKWSGSSESTYPLDYAVIAQHGYDSQRYFSADAPLNGINNSFKANVYVVDKLLTYHTMVVGDTLLKFEATAAHIHDDPLMLGGLHVKDYYQLGMGFEHTLVGILADTDLGVIGEYYRYETFKHGDEVADDLALFQIFQNDLFTGLRYSFNDAASSSILAGAVIDLKYAEQSYRIEYETRLFDVLSLKADWAYINPSKHTQTAYAMLQRHQRFGLNIAYYF